MSWILRGLEGPARGQDFPLDAPEMTVGRVRPGPQRAVGWVFMPDETVSGTQAKLRWNEDHYVLVNHSKTNPTTVNGAAVQEVPLSPGDRIRFGESLLELVGAPVKAPAPAPVQAPVYFLEPLEGGPELAVWAPVVALGGSPSPQHEPWYGQELILQEPSLSPLGLQLRWVEAQKAYELSRRAARELEVVVERRMDELPWSARLSANPALLEAGDVFRVGSAAWRLKQPANSG